MNMLVRHLTSRQSRLGHDPDHMGEYERRVRILRRLKFTHCFILRKQNHIRAVEGSHKGREWIRNLETMFI